MRCRRPTAASTTSSSGACRLFRRLLCRCLRLSLLRHCCPPSLSGWRHRCSAVANRSALPSDYYSRKKITVTPLNFVCKCRAPPPPPLARRDRPAKRAAKNFSPARSRAKNSTRCRSADEMRVSATSHFAVLRARARAPLAARSALSRGAIDAAVGGFTTPKKFCTGRLRGRVDGLAAAQNARISANRFAPRHVPRPRAAPRGVAAREIFASVSAGDESARRLSPRVRRAPRNVALRPRSASSGDR